jgi:hypothetical protein
LVQANSNALKHGSFLSLTSPIRPLQPPRPNAHASFETPGSTTKTLVHEERNASGIKTRTLPHILAECIVSCPPQQLVDSFLLNHEDLTPLQAKTQKLCQHLLKYDTDEDCFYVLWKQQRRHNIVVEYLLKLVVNR